MLLGQSGRNGHARAEVRRGGGSSLGVRPVYQRQYDEMSGIVRGGRSWIIPGDFAPSPMTRRATRLQTGHLRLRAMELTVLMTSGSQVLLVLCPA